MAQSGCASSCLSLSRCHRAVLYQRLYAGSAMPPLMFSPPCALIPLRPEGRVRERWRRHGGKLKRKARHNRGSAGAQNHYGKKLT